MLVAWQAGTWVHKEAPKHSLSRCLRHLLETAIQACDSLFFHPSGLLLADIHTARAGAESMSLPALVGSPLRKEPGRRQLNSQAPFAAGRGLACKAERSGDVGAVETRESTLPPTRALD